MERARLAAPIVLCVVLAMGIGATWFVPRLDIAPASPGGCTAVGTGAAECRFDCVAGEHPQVSVEVEWAFGLTKARGTATCGEETATCTTGASRCVSATAASGQSRAQGGEGTCRAEKLFFAWLPGSVRVACRTGVVGDA